MHDLAPIKNQLVTVNIDDVDSDTVPDPRIIPSSKAQDEADKESLKKHGQLQPVLLGRPSEGRKYLLIAGRRRVRLLREIGAETVLAVVRPEPSTPETIEGLYRDLAAAENIHRADMHPVEIAAEVQRRADAKQSHAAIADALKLGFKNVGNYARLAQASFFPTMVNRVKAEKPVPSYRKALDILTRYPAPKTKKGIDVSAEQQKRDRDVLEAFEFECRAEEKAIAVAQERAASTGHANTGKGKSKKGGSGNSASLKPREKWVVVRDWWKAVEKGLRLDKHPADGRKLTPEEFTALKACDELLTWLYRTKGDGRTPPVLVPGDEYPFGEKE
jgi:ParB/RepB/Spo0J family partition protein